MQILQNLASFSQEWQIAEEIEFEPLLKSMRMLDASFGALSQAAVLRFRNGKTLVSPKAARNDTIQFDERF